MKISAGKPAASESRNLVAESPTASPAIQAGKTAGRRQRSANDEELIRQAAQGNPEALECLFERYHQALYPTALKLLGNPQDAEDALQEGMLSAYRNLRRFEGRSRFSTWLTRIVINAALMRLRSRRAHTWTSLEEETPGYAETPLADMLPDRRPDPEQNYAQKERHEMLARGMKELPRRLRSVLELRDIQGLSTQEAARRLGIPQGTLKSQLHRARTKLAALLQHTSPWLRSAGLIASRGFAAGLEPAG